MRKYCRAIKQAKRKDLNLTKLALEAQLPMEELISGACQDIETFAAELGLTIMSRVMEAEIQRKVGRWGQQPVHRHGHQPGYVLFGGRKVSLERPRLRNRQDQEVKLASYAAFQQKGKLQEDVARLFSRQCSSRDYEGAIDSCLQGYGIKRSSVSRHWKAATAQQLEQLMERPVPKELLVLMIDSKYFAGECVAAAIGIDIQGRKHVLGLWYGATENATVVTALLEDLVGRGLDPEQKLLVVIDGAKALRKGVKIVLGEQCLVQRCRIHKARNVLDHLPKDKQPQAAWRLRAAWAQKDPTQAKKELDKVVRWLQGIAPGAAASLQEGLEETLTVQQFGLHRDLARVLSNTNIIENWFSQVAHQTRRVKRWQDPKMILRWTASCVLRAESRFRRIEGCDQIKDLEKHLRNLENNPTLKAS
jgi:transposase-like protein